MDMISLPKTYVDAVAECAAHIGQSITFRGTIHRVRDMSDFSFLILRVDRGLIQCLVQGDSISGISRTDIRDAMVVEVTGIVHEEVRAENGFEVTLTDLTIISRPYEKMPVPLSKKYMGINLETNLDYRPVTMRHPRMKAIFRIQAAIADGFAEYMRSQGFVHMTSPKIVAAGAEGGANIFKLSYFGQKAYLAQSPQFYKQYLACVYGRVFEVGDVFRAERHSTSRHLNEYMGLDFEMAYIDSMRDVMEMETGMLRYVTDFVRKECPQEIELLGADIPVIDTIPSVTFREAKQIMLEKYGHKSKNRYDLNPDEEQMLCRYAKETYNTEFLFVTHFPSAKRPFYAMDDPEDPSVAFSFDLLFRGLEITTGGQRIHDYEMQCRKMEERGMDLSLFESFLLLHKYGAPPHGGLGIGLERLTMQLLGLHNIREASGFPRDMSRLIP
jgi:nondiscriminating aspartyl-tRNA synthetase